MYTIMIVDDEEIIREGIASYIAQTFDHVTVAAVLEDGAQAIEYLKSTDIDIVLTDIRMSVVSGIALAQYVYDHNLQTKVLFLSGYKEFEYARQALKYNVKQYISKPVYLPELKSAIAETIAEIDEERQKKNSLQNSLKELELLHTLTKTDFFADILMGSLTGREQIQAKAAAIGIEPGYLQNKCCVFTAALQQPEQWLHAKEDFYTAVANLLRDITQINECILILKKDYRLTYVAVTDKFESIAQLEHYIRTSFLYLNQSALLSIAFTLEFTCADVYSLTKYYKLDYKKSHDFSLLEHKFRDILAAIAANQRQEAKQILDELQQYANDLDLAGVKNLFSQLFSTVVQALAERFPAAGMCKSHLDIRTANSRSAVFSICNAAINEIFRVVTPKPDMEDYTLQKAKAFIRENYMKDISLDDIANVVYLNPVYFSRFFKLSTGMNVTDYLIEVRMKAAISLLKERQYKIYEISERCGYKSSKYFAKAFKQYTGYTPTEYSRLITLEGESK